MYMLMYVHVFDECGIVCEAVFTKSLPIQG